MILGPLFPSDERLKLPVVEPADLWHWVHTSVGQSITMTGLRFVLQKTIIQISDRSLPNCVFWMWENIRSLWLGPHST